MAVDKRLLVGPRLLGIYKGGLVSGYNDYRPSAPAQTLHKGWDIVASTGTVVRALDDAVVIRARGNDSVSGYHNEVTVYYPSGLCWVLYGHLLDQMVVRPGASVRQGDILGMVGSSQDAMWTAPHAHVQVWKSEAAMRRYSNDEAVTPSRLVAFYGSAAKVP